MPKRFYRGGWELYFVKLPGRGGYIPPSLSLLFSPRSLLDILVGFEDYDFMKAGFNF